MSNEKLKAFWDHPCGACGADLKLESGPGRTFSSRGEIYDTPEWIALPVCTGCDANWVSHNEAERLSKAAAEQDANDIANGKKPRWADRPWCTVCNGYHRYMTPHYDERSYGEE